MQESFKTIIDTAQSVLILVPTKPYFDQVAAALSLYLALRDQKSVSIVSPTETTVEFNRLIGVNRITQNLGNKNLVIRFADYKADDIERVSYDIENREFRLTVIPKTNLSAPQKDQVNLSYSGVSSDLVILIGGTNESHFPALSSKDIDQARFVHVGNKQISIDPAKKVLSFAGKAATVSEIVAYLVNEAQLKVDSDIATNLLMGIEEGTSNFTTSQVSAQTFQLVASLMQLGGKRVSQQGIASAQDFPQGAIPKTSSQSTQKPQVSQPTQNVQGYSAAQPVTQVPAGDSQSQKEEIIKEKDAPKDWLKPKIFKGGQQTANSKLDQQSEQTKGTSIK
jgi:hypothetical protein